MVQIEDQAYYNVEMLDFLKFVQDQATPNRAAVDAYRKLVSLNNFIIILVFFCFVLCFVLCYFILLYFI